jgi:hypothetical protein
MAFFVFLIFCFIAGAVGTALRQQQATQQAAELAKLSPEELQKMALIRQIQAPTGTNSAVNTAVGVAGGIVAAEIITDSFDL